MEIRFSDCSFMWTSWSRTTTEPFSAAAQISGTRWVVLVSFSGFLQTEANKEHAAADNTKSPKRKAWKHVYSYQNRVQFF